MFSSMERDPTEIRYGTSWEIYRDIVHTSRQIVVVGPGSVLADPTLLLISTLKAQRNGEILIVDPKNYATKADVSSSPHVAQGGIGNAEWYVEQLQFLHDSGLSLKLPEWTGADSRAQHMRRNGEQLQNGWADLIVDHCTLGFLVQYFSQKAETSSKFISKMVQEIASEYDRVVKPGGMICIQMKTSECGFTDDPRNLSRFNLNRLFPGYIIEKYSVIDDTVITVNYNEFQQANERMDIFVENGDIPPVRFSRYECYQFNDRVCIHLQRAGKIGPDFYVLTKRKNDL
jgi:hypothetical protein